MRMKTTRALALSVALGPGSLAMAQVAGAPAPVTRPARAAAVQVVTDPSTVCMMNDRVMGQPQIPVVVEGKTYYGCCAMCKERLASDAAARTASDPVTGRTVDKAKAVIARRADGSVLYFESKDTLRRYRARAAKS
jgi:YHS domain-containing protein